MGPTPIYSQTLNGDFVVASNSTRQDVPYPATIPQVSPFAITLTGIPAGATVVQAYANWSYETENLYGIASVPEASITVDGNPVTGTLTGSARPDFTWGRMGTDAYTADITSIVAASGNGAYTITGAVDSATPSSLGEGMSILAVWTKAGSPLKNVDIYSGLTTTVSGPCLATYQFDSPYEGGATNFFINALDGQSPLSDQGTIDGIDMVTGLTGVGPVGNTWEGLVGPNGTDNLYDQATGDVSSYMHLGDNSLVVQTEGYSNGGGTYGDAVGSSFGAISFGVVPEPASISLLFGAGILMRRRGQQSA